MNKVIACLLLALMTISSASAQDGSAIKDNCVSDDPTAAAQTPSSDPIQVDVYFEMPEFIEAGLANGSMERVGGVIRYTDDQQILAWLRQGGQAGQVAESSAGLLQGVVSKHSTIGIALGGVVPVLHIAMAGLGLIEHLNGIRVHEAELERIYDRVSDEFQRNREVELLAALNHAENAFVARCDAFKVEAVAHVTYELTVAQAQLVRDLDELLDAERNEANIELATLYQVLAMKVCAVSTRLRLEIGEDAAAIHWLSKCVVEHRAYAEEFVRKWVGENPALYFHESVSDEFFDRYVDIERWLQGKRVVLPDLIKAHRRSFWNIEALQQLDAPPIGFQIDENPFYLYAIPNAELLIENFQRLFGYELELGDLLLPFSEWDVYGTARIENHEGYVVLVNQALLDDAS